MNILEKIVAHKRAEVAVRKNTIPIFALEKKPYFNGPTLSLKEYLNRSSGIGIIAELKRQSPSKGVLRQTLNVEEISIGYMQHGASALSVLTDTHFFGGSHADLEVARFFNLCPILCKDFLVEEYQIVEARAFGADVILLIAGVLDESTMKNFIDTAHSLGLEVLVEISNDEELAKIQNLQWDHVGVNSRDLRDFSVSIERSLNLAAMLPLSASKIAESGIDSPETLVRLRKGGYNGFLIGEQFITANDAGKACGKMIRESKKILGIT
jgi:indole-3-glycerol phosphate synthase